MVITSALHAEGPGFNPRSNLSFGNEAQRRKGSSLFMFYSNFRFFLQNVIIFSQFGSKVFPIKPLIQKSLLKPIMEHKDGKVRDEVRN